MVRDYFSVFSKDNRAFLLRIHQKVDFAEEVAWAHCWFCRRNDFLNLVAPMIVNYLVDGFDIIENWENLDEKGWHENVHHLGFIEELVETNLVPEIIRQQEALPRLIEEKLRTKSIQKTDSGIPTCVGPLSDALNKAGFLAQVPRDPEATIYIPIKDVVEKNWLRLADAIEVFA